MTHVVYDRPPAGRPAPAYDAAGASVRSFRPDPVPDEFLTEILEVARWTGSGSNRQPWTFIVVRERATLGAIATASPNVGHIAEAAAAIIIVMDGEMPEIETFDEGRVAERILIAATALGLASAIGWIVPAGAAPMAALLGVPQGRRARTLVSLGYPTEEAPTRSPPRARRDDPLRRWCASSDSP